MRKLFPLYCGRCGADVSDRRGGQLAPDDYVELWHEHCRLESEHKRLQGEFAEALERIDQLLALVEVLEPPTPEQIELRQLRAVVAAIGEPAEEGCPF